MTVGLLDAVLGTGRAIIVTGVEPDDEEPNLLRVYIGPRYHWRYVLVEDEEAKREMRGAFGGSSHLFIPKPGPGVPQYQDPRVPARYALPEAQSWNAT